MLMSVRGRYVINTTFSCLASAEDANRNVRYIFMGTLNAEILEQHTVVRVSLVF